MSTIKISQLTSISQLSSNTSNTLLVAVDTASSVTGKITAKAFGDGLYAYNILSVGSIRDNYPNTLGQFTGSSNTYAQVNVKNTNSNGSIDFIGTADTGTDTTNFIDVGINNSTFNDSNYSSMTALDGYLYVNGNGNNLIGNLIIGTGSPNTETKFVSSGLLSSNVIAKITNTGFKIISGKTLIFGDDTYQTTAASPVNYTQGIYDLANTHTTAISTANTFLQSNDAITLAAAKEYALANTNNIVTAGNLTVSSNLTSNGTVTINCSTASSVSSAVRITGSPNAVVQAAINDGYMLQITGKSGSPTRVVVDTFGTGLYGLVAGRSGRGTAASPTNTANNDVLFRIAGNGYANSGFSQFGTGRIDFVAAENYTDTSKGSRIEFWNTPNSSNTIQKIASFNANSIEFTGTVAPQKGFIYTPNVISGSTSTITLDIANTSLFKCNSSSGLTVTLAHYSPGKVVELWFVNSAGSTQTVTHGCLANNSTTGSSSFTLAGGHAAYLRYFSIDSNLSETFVSIQYQ